MQILARSILLPLLRRRHDNIAIAPASRRCLCSSMAAAPPRFWRWPRPRALARGDLPLSAPPNRPVRRLVSRYRNEYRNMASCTSGIRGDDQLGKLDNDEANGRATSLQDGEKHVRKKATRDILLLCGDGPPGAFSDDEEFTRLEAEQLYSDCFNYPADEDVGPMFILPYSTHRDASIYRGAYAWKKEYRVADRNETWFDAMMLSDPKDCLFYGGTCRQHKPGRMLQFFSLELAKIQVEGGPVELYGYIATRDVLDPLLNYVVNFNRDDPILVEQGSLIEMTGPKRGIELCDTTLIEYDMRIKKGKQEKDDLQLIDGVSIVHDLTTTPNDPFTRRIHGNHGAVDITVSHLVDAVEATVEVTVSKVQSNFSLCACCFISGLHEEIQIFDGTISELRDLRRSVVAVVVDTWMDLKFRVGSGPCYNSNEDAEHCCTFKATNHGYTSQLLKVKFATILVKVTWSTLSFPSSRT